jgi:2-keto-4-pentenoate hydratase
VTSAPAASHNPSEVAGENIMSAFKLGFALGTVAVAFTGAAQAACLTDQQLAPLVTGWTDDTKANWTAPTDLTMADAQCTQDKFIALLTPAFGKVVGWKVAATSTTIQAAVHGGPTRGAMLDKMLVPESTAPVKLMAPLRGFEADLILQVKDDGINNAVTPLDVLAHLSNMVPFIEMPGATAQQLAAGYTMSPALLTAINSVARQGIVGKPIPMTATWDWVIALGAMNVVLIQDGKEVSRVPGAASLGNPLNAVAWLIQDLKASGKKLNAGDLISTGTFSSPVTPAAGQSFTVRYEGIPTADKTATVSVTFN